MRFDQRLKPALLFREELLKEGRGHVLPARPIPAPMDMQPVPDGIGRKRLQKALRRHLRAVGVVPHIF